MFYTYVMNTHLTFIKVLKWLFFSLLVTLNYSVNALQIGDKAPNFKASTSQGDIDFYEWSDKQWVILFSHPGDFTPVCTTELATAAILQPEFKKRGVKLIGLSGDSLEDHMEWIPHINRFKNELIKKDNLINNLIQSDEETDVNYPIIADESLEIAAQYDMYHPLAYPNANSIGSPLKETIRSVFVIDNDKKIKTILVYPKNIGRNFDEILRIVDALQLSEKHKVSTPANWQPGDDVIVSNDIPLEDIKDKYDTKEVNFFEDYLKFIDQPEFFEGSEKGKDRAKGKFK